MSVCVVAEYPWKAVRTLLGSEPPGMIMCSDTLVVAGQPQQPLDILLAKQYDLSRNLVVCYASSNVDATVRAVVRCAGTSNVRRLGEVLRESHKKYLGVTELLACVWETGGERQQILEVMPPSYEPRPRSGIVGIGDRDVLERFKGVFVEDPTPHIPGEATPEMLENVSKSFGYRVDVGPRFPIQKAATEVVSAFTEAIEDVASPTVALPVHPIMITKEGVTSLQAVLRSAPGKYRPLTTPTDKLSLLNRFKVPRGERYFGPYVPAVQLFE
jgi:hypothetical protein